MFLIRWPLGRLILLLNFIFSPSSPKRTKEEQDKIDLSTQNLKLYQLPACPFCVKVRRSMKRSGLNIELKNINKDESLRQELIEQGGKRTVPCLKITDENQNSTWLYESSDIIDYLKAYT